MLRADIRTIRTKTTLIKVFFILNLILSWYDYVRENKQDN